MLVLGRKPRQSVRIGDIVTIEILEINNGKVRLGFIADKGIRILRAELTPNETPTGRGSLGSQSGSSVPARGSLKNVVTRGVNRQD